METLKHLKRQSQYIDDNELKRDIEALLTHLENGEKRMALSKINKLKQRSVDSFWLWSALIDTEQELIER